MEMDIGLPGVKVNVGGIKDNVRRTDLSLCYFYTNWCCLGITHLENFWLLGHRDVSTGTQFWSFGLLRCVLENIVWEHLVLLMSLRYYHPLWEMKTHVNIYALGLDLLLPHSPSVKKGEWENERLTWLGEMMDQFSEEPGPDLSQAWS
jgi:hypothetical protein